jgi:cell division protease FtsH
MSARVKVLALCGALAALAVVLFALMRAGHGGERQISFSEFVNAIEQRQVKAVVIAGPQVTGAFKRGEPFRVQVPDNFPDLYRMLIEARVDVSIKDMRATTWQSVAINLTPALVLGACVYFVISRMWFPPGGNRPRGEVL